MQSFLGYGEGLKTSASNARVAQSCSTWKLPPEVKRTQSLPVVSALAWACRLAFS